MTTVCVTGSASGIGAACASRLTGRGATIIGVDLVGADVVADLGTAEGRTAAVEGVLERTGGVLDGLVTCAGLGGKPSRAGSLLASVNYFGTIALLDGFRDALSRGASPSAVAISSVSTTIQPGVPMDVVAACLADDEEEEACRAADEAGSLATYPATKLAIAHWIRQRAVGPTWVGQGIRLNAIAPGLVDTPLAAEQRDDPVVGPLVKHFPIPMGRPAQPQEIAALVDFLLGPDSGYFCGSIVFADGGSDAQIRPLDWPAAWEI